MKKALFITAGLLVCFLIWSQNPVKTEDKIFNYGAKVGLNSSFPIINRISINGVGAENLSFHYKVGLSGAVFCRINFDDFFVQPSLQWRHSSGDILYDLPSLEASMEVKPPGYLLTFKENALEAPILIGYKIVKEGAYGLSFMAGPNIKYLYDVQYGFGHSEYQANNTPWEIGIACGVGVSIGRFFFDFTYEFGLNQVDSDFRYYSYSVAERSDLTIDKRTNMLSFSLGFLF